MPGIVDDHVDAPEPLARPCQRRCRGAALAHVEHRDQDGVAVVIGQVCEFFGTPSRRGDVIAALERRRRDRSAEPSRRAGDEPHLGHAFLRKQGNVSVAGARAERRSAGVTVHCARPVFDGARAAPSTRVTGRPIGRRRSPSIRRM
jgi:hypothetical protein